MFTVIAYAADSLPAEAVRVIDNIKAEIINPLIAFLFAIATLYFLWGVYKFIRDADSDTARVTGQQAILYGLVGMFIMVGVYGIMWFLCNTIQCQGV